MALIGSLLLAIWVNMRTVATFPSWFDEAFFANISFNLATGKGMVLDLVPGFQSGAVYQFGPVYFGLQAILIEGFGLSSLAFRLPNLISAYLGLAVFVLVLRQCGVGRNGQMLYALAGLADVSFNRNAVSGRMDMVSVLFVVLALFLVTRPALIAGRRAAFSWAVVGGMCSLAYLTTPRAAFLLPAVGMVALFHLNRARQAESVNSALTAGVVAAAAFGVPIALWIAYVGGPSTYIALFESHQMTQHVGVSLFRSVYDNIAISVMLVTCAIRWRALWRDQLMLALIATYLSFSLFVKEVGPYAGMIMPFVLAIIVVGLDKLDGRIATAVMAMVATPGLLLLVVREYDLRVNAACRNMQSTARVIDLNVGRDWKVVAPFSFYFLLERKSRDVITLEYAQRAQSTLLERADAVLTAGGQPNSIDNAAFKPAHEFRCAPRRTPVLPDSFYKRSVYSGVLYVRRDEHPH